MRKLHGTVAFITGASSGIGAALAVEYARCGADTALAARREDRLDQVAGQVRAFGRRAVTLGCDVTREGDLGGAVERTLADFGRIDWVIANAGFGVAGAFHKLSLDDYRRQFETNVFGVLRTAYATRDALIASRGCLAVMGSVAGYVAAPLSSPYSMSKAAIHALAACLWHELAAYDVGVTLIAPGFVESEIRQVDNQGVHDPEAPDSIPDWLPTPADRAARAMVSAVARRRRMVVITGHGRIAVWLQRLAPGLLAALVRRMGPRRRRDSG
jgi:short-subunit dehydrogenase